MNIKCTGKFIGGELISRRVREGEGEGTPGRELKVYRCFSISIAAAFQGRAVFPSINYFADAWRRSLPRTTPLPRPIRIGVGRGYSILCTYTDYRACHDRHTFDTTRIKRVAIQLPLRFFISLSLVSFLPVRRVERRFSDRGQISRKDGITICKRTGGVGNRSSCLRFDVSSPTPIFPFSSLHFVRFPLFLRSFPLSLSLLFRFSFFSSFFHARERATKSQRAIIE